MLSPDQPEKKDADAWIYGAQRFEQFVAFVRRHELFGGGGSSSKAMFAVAHGDLIRSWSCMADDFLSEIEARNYTRMTKVNLKNDCPLNKGNFEENCAIARVGYKYETVDKLDVDVLYSGDEALSRTADIAEQDCDKASGYGEYTQGDLASLVDVPSEFFEGVEQCSSP